MKPRSPLDKSARFRGHLKHYHRSGPAPRQSWDAWIDGGVTRSKASRNWLKIVGVVLAVLALGAVAAGLIIELQ